MVWYDLAITQILKLFQPPMMYIFQTTNWRPLADSWVISSSTGKGNSKDITSWVYSDLRTEKKDQGICMELW